MNDFMITGIGLVVLTVILAIITFFILRKRTSKLRVIAGSATGLSAFFAILTALFVFYLGNVPESVIGTPDSPDLIAINSGETVKLDDFSGKIIVVNLWATWCPPCLEEFPYFERLQSEYKNAGNIEIVLVSTEDHETLKNFHKNHAISLPSYSVNPDAAMFKDIYIRPVTLIFGKAGELMHSHFGSLDYEELLSLINDSV